LPERVTKLTVNVSVGNQHENLYNYIFTYMS